jgi:histone acetyltransferase (RNA polymerase elongator complex component)
MKQITVPFFISHQGCPHTCVFCDQRIISGSAGALPDAATIHARIDEWISSANGRTVEVAFFGGTFTALPDAVQHHLLDPVQTYLSNGLVSHVRISTRPDCISQEKVKWLSGMGVRIIELGVQSMDDEVLRLSGRGHNADSSDAAIRCVAACGLTAGAQLMPGLPGDTVEKSVASLERVIGAGASLVRIYPVVVLKGTRLADMTLSGDYHPLTVGQGVDICKQMLLRAMQHDIKVIRIGLQADQGLNSDSIMAGCWHPAFGQLVRSELYFDLLQQMLAQFDPAEQIEISVHPDRVADLIGHRRTNLIRLSEQGWSVARVTDSDVLQEDQIVVENIKQKIKSDIVTSLKY